MLYSGRLLRDVDGAWCLLGFRNMDGDGFVGDIPDPVPVAWTGDRLVDRPGDPSAGRSGGVPAAGSGGIRPNHWTEGPADPLRAAG
jgi:hypothetical protein